MKVDEIAVSISNYKFTYNLTDGEALEAINSLLHLGRDANFIVN